MLPRIDSVRVEGEQLEKKCTYLLIPIGGPNMKSSKPNDDSPGRSRRSNVMSCS